MLLMLAMCLSAGPIQAEAPQSIIAVTVADIPKGSKAMVNPEAMVIDDNKKIWLHKHGPVGSEAGLTVLHLADDSYAVEITDGKLQWLKTALTDDMKKSLIPVSKLTIAPSKNDEPKPVEPKKN